MTKTNLLYTERLEWGPVQWIEDTVCNSGALLMCPGEEAFQVPAGRNSHVWRGQLHLPVGSHVVAGYWGRQINWQFLHIEHFGHFGQLVIYGNELLQPDDCEWVACIDPPLPLGHNLKNDFDGITPYDFYTNATYECKDGFFFEQASAVLHVKNVP